MENEYEVSTKKQRLSRQPKIIEHRQKMTPKIKEHVPVKCLSPRAKIPTKKTDGAAGFDLTSPMPVYIPPHSFRSIGTKIAVQIPKGYCGKIEGRSGLAKTSGIAVLGGVIDSDYRGEVEVMLMNLGPYPLDLPENSRIAQLLILKLYDSDEMREVEELNDTERNKSGFGSTGLGI